MTSKDLGETIKAGMDYAAEHEKASRAHVMIFLHGYNQELTFNQLVSVTRIISVELGKPFNW